MLCKKKFKPYYIAGAFKLKESLFRQGEAFHFNH